MGIVEMLEVFNLGSPMIVVVAICVFMGVFGYRVQRLEENLKELEKAVVNIAKDLKDALEKTANGIREDLKGIKDDIKADLENTKENTVWYPTCKAKHEALEQRITRLEILANGNLTKKSGG